MKTGQGTRKVRSDKRREVKPTLSLHLKDAVYIISYVTDTPVKDVAERICTDGLTSKKVIGSLSPRFRRTVRLANTMYMGDLELPTLRRNTLAEKTGRLSLRFLGPDYDDLNTLAYALDCTPSRACALLLDASIRDSNFINEYFKEFIKTKLDDNRMRELRKVIRYLNVENPYDESISWGMLLSYIFANMKDSAATFADSLNDFIDKWR